MRRIWIKGIHTILIPLLISSCSYELHEKHDIPEGPIEVGFFAGGAQTRTEMLQNGLSAQWTPDDKLAVWALGSNGLYALSNQEFNAYGIDGKHGFFTTMLDTAMPEDTYLYYCCYPVPESVDGTNVTFNLPALQDGKVSGGADIMIAHPVSYGPLIPLTDVEDHSGMTMSMKRMMHQFRFYVPEDDVQLQGEEIERIILTFPTQVVGRVSADISLHDTETVLLSGYREVTLNLAEPLAKEKQNFACVAFVPTQFQAGDMLHLKAYTKDKIVQIDPIDLKSRYFEAGHSTAVRLMPRAVMDYPYVLNFTVSGNNLGENSHSIILKAPAGCVWPASGTNIYTYSPGHEIRVGETVSFRFEDKEQYMAFSGAEVNVTFDSEHAVTYAKTKVNTITIEGDTDQETFSADLPYLFYEDFSNLVVYDGDYKVGVNTTVEGASLPAKDLSSYGLPVGWSGARTGCDNAGTAILVGSRVDYVIAGATRSYGRLESPALSALKKEADIKVTFDYGGSRSGSNSFYAVGVCGYVYGEGLLNGYATQFLNDPSWTDISGINSIPDIPKNGNATTLKTMSYVVSGCDGYCRLSWHVGGMGTAFIANGLQWMYVDNVKVQILNN